MSEPNIVSPSMRLIVPYAQCTAEGARQAWATLDLPHLYQLSQLLMPGSRFALDEDSPTLPHEWALAQSMGLPEGGSPAADSTPWAAWDALQCLGSSSLAHAWAWITPCHWQVGTSHIAMSDTQALGLSEVESRALLDILAPFFKDDGIALHYRSPDRWLARGEIFRTLRAPSLDRVIGRSIDGWMPQGPTAKQLRRLQTETQMLLYTHPFSEARQAQGAPSINSVWISGCGARPQGWQAPQATPHVWDDLRKPALAGDWKGWTDAWQQLDAGPIAQYLRAAQQGTPTELTLCGELALQRWHGPRRGRLSRWAARLQGTSAFKQGLASL